MGQLPEIQIDIVNRVTGIARPAKSRPTNLPALTYLGHEWMTAGIIPVAPAPKTSG